MSRKNRHMTEFNPQFRDDDDTDTSSTDIPSLLGQQVAPLKPSAPRPSSEQKPAPAKKPRAAAKTVKTSADFSPLDPFSAAGTAIGPDRLARIVWAFLALGILVRAIRYLLDFPLWPDEAYLAHNFLDRNYLELLKPLDFGQVAPLLYLWIQKAAVTVGGFSEYSLRLFAFAGSIASLFLFRQLATRLLQGLARLLAIGTFAVAYPLVRYAAEAKPYGSDMLVALGLLVLLVEWRLRHREQQRWSWAMALAMPLAVLLSYPAMFIVPTVLLAMGVELIRTGTGREWLSWIAVSLLAAGSLALLFYSSAQAQMNTAGPQMRSGWTASFPPLHSPKALAWFLLDSHSSEAFSYPTGGSHGASTLTTVCCLAALVVLLRARQFWLAMVFGMPLILNFTAAALHAYPYAGHARVMLYMAPILCLMNGLGAAGLLYWFQNRRWPVVAPTVITIAFLVGVGGVASVRDFLKPYKETCWQRNRDFARWFWNDKAINAELVDVTTDLKFPVSLPPNDDGLASVYFCNQRIYSDRLAKRQAADIEHCSTDKPLRCARFRPSATTDKDDAKFQDWLKAMQSKYQLVAAERYPLTFFVHEKELQFVDRVEVYEFVRPPDDVAQRPGRLQ